MTTVAVMPHHLRPRAIALAKDVIAWLEAGGHTARVPEADAKVTGLTAWAARTEELLGGLDLALSLGGDGTMLRTVDLVIAAWVPVLGVNVGHLGYLTEVEADDLLGALDRFVAGDYEVENRMTLDVDVAADPSGDARRAPAALNEAVVEKTLSGHTVRLAVSINGRPFTTYAADGLIVSTPTGSTAYNLSARGPIVSPRHRALLLTPVSPHMLFDRTLVLGADEEVELEVLEGPPAALVVDGRELGQLAAGDRVRVRAGDLDARLVRFGERDFHGILKTKFGLADR